jgi:hypothetical protein
MAEEFDIQGNVVVSTGDAEATLQKLRDKQTGLDNAAAAKQTAAWNKMGSAALVAGAALAAGLGIMVKGAAESETANLSLARSLLNTGQYSIAAMARIDSMTNSLRKQTTVSDETQKAALSFAGTMKLTETQAEALLPRLLDMSAVTGMDLQQGFRASAQAMTGNVGLFQRYGVIIQKNADGTVDFNNLLKQLAIYEGQAAEKMSGMEGASKKLASATVELGESLGKTLIPELTKTFGSVTSLVEKFNDMSDATKGVITQSALVAGGILLIGGTALKTIVGIAKLKTAIDLLTAGAGWASLMTFLSGPGAVIAIAATAAVLATIPVPGYEKPLTPEQMQVMTGTDSAAYRAYLAQGVTPGTMQGVREANTGISNYLSRTWTSDMQNALVLSNNRPTPTLTGAFSADQITANEDIAHKLYDATHTGKQQELHDLDLEVAAYRKAGDDKVLIAQYSAARRAQIEKQYAKETATWSPINVSGVNVTGLSSYIGSLSGAVKVKKEELQLTLKIDGTSIKVDQSALAKLKDTLGALVFAKVMAALGGSAAFGG